MISFEQPPTEGLFGAEGKCGQTCAANLILLWGGKCEGPTDPRIVELCRDLTPGVHPRTLTKCLRTLLNDPTIAARKADWETLKGLLPAAVLLAYGNLELHWVTAVSMTAEEITFLDKGTRTTQSREAFSKLWDYSRCHPLMVRGFALAGCGPFTTITRVT